MLRSRKKHSHPQAAMGVATWVISESSWTVDSSAGPVLLSLTSSTGFLFCYTVCFHTNSISAGIIHQLSSNSLASFLSYSGQFLSFCNMDRLRIFQISLKFLHFCVLLIIPSSFLLSSVVVAVFGDWVSPCTPGWLQTGSDPPASGV